MTFEDFKWAMRELAASLRHPPECGCSRNSRLAYTPREKQPSEETALTVDGPASTEP